MEGTAVGAARAGRGLGKVAEDAVALSHPSPPKPHGQLTPHYPLQGSGLEVQGARVWLSSGIVPVSPGSRSLFPPLTTQ